MAGRNSVRSPFAALVCGALGCFGVGFCGLGRGLPRFGTGASYATDGRSGSPWRTLRRLWELRGRDSEARYLPASGINLDAPCLRRRICRPRRKAGVRRSVTAGLRLGHRGRGSALRTSRARIQRSEERESTAAWAGPTTQVKWASRRRSASSAVINSVRVRSASAT